MAAQTNEVFLRDSDVQRLLRIVVNILPREGKETKTEGKSKG